MNILERERINVGDFGSLTHKNLVSVGALVKNNFVILVEQ